MASRRSIRAGFDLDAEGSGAVHGGRERLGAAHAAEPGGHAQPAREAAAEVAPAHGGQRFVSALQDSLRADVDPAARGHLPVHRQSTILEIAEGLERRPRRYEQRIGDEHARGVVVRPEDADGFPRLHEQRLVVVEGAERRDDRVECGPAARGTARAAVHHQILRAFGDVGIEVVHEHPQGGFLRPALARASGAAGRADDAGLSLHGEPGTSGAKG